MGHAPSAITPHTFAEGLVCEPEGLAPWFHRTDGLLAVIKHWTLQRLHLCVQISYVPDHEKPHLSDKVEGNVERLLSRQASDLHLWNKAEVGCWSSAVGTHKMVANHYCSTVTPQETCCVHSKHNLTQTTLHFLKFVQPYLFLTS